MEKGFEDRWAALVAFLEERFQKMPNMEAILFLVGLNEYSGRIPKIKFSKEQKQELMHVGVCAVLARAGHYRFIYTDHEGWPHYEKIRAEQPEDLLSQEQLLKENLLLYFDF
jgi:hypothetical protein